MENLLNILPIILYIVLWAIAIHAIVNYNPRKEMKCLMKDERGDDVIIYKVKMQFDKYHNYIHEITFRVGDDTYEGVEKYAIEECGRIVQKLGVCATMKITLIDEDTGEQKVLWKIRKSGEESELVDSSEERIYNCHV